MNTFGKGKQYQKQSRSTSKENGITFRVFLNFFVYKNQNYYNLTQKI